MKLTARQLRLLTIRYCSMAPKRGTEAFNPCNPDRDNWGRLVELGLLTEKTEITEAGRAHVAAALAIDVPEPGPSLDDLRKFPGVHISETQKTILLIRDDGQGILTRNTPAGRAEALKWLRANVPPGSGPQCRCRVEPVDSERGKALSSIVADLLREIFKPAEDEETRLLQELRGHPHVKSVEVHRRGDDVSYVVRTKDGGYHRRDVAGLRQLVGLFNR